MIQSLNFCGIASLCGKRHCPSSAIRAPIKLPSLSSITELVGLVNSSLGRTKMYPISKRAIMAIANLSLVLCFEKSIA